jgi:hypothetical protein
MANAFIINQVGTWPEENYVISLSSLVIKPDILFPAENIFRPWFCSKNNFNFLTNFYYISTTVLQNPYSINYIALTANNFDFSTFIWNISADRRQYDYGPIFNYFYVNVGVGDQDNDAYAYSLYPSRMLILPYSLIKTSTGWTLSTKLVLTNYNTYQFQVSTKQSDSASFHENVFMANTPSNNILSLSNANYAIVYNLSAARIKADYPLISYTSDNMIPPYYFNKILETTPAGINSAKIRPDSTSISYNSEFYIDDGSISIIGEQRSDNIHTFEKSFDSSYIFSYNPNINNTQTFQLVQYKNDNSKKDLGLSQYSILSANLNLNTTNFNLYSKKFINQNNTVYSLTSGIPGDVLAISYIADAPVFKGSNEYPLKTANTSWSLGNPVPTTTTGYVSSYWTLKYPPHYYSFKASLSCNTLSAAFLGETASLNFYTYSNIISSSRSLSNYTTSITLSTYITSDFNAISYDLFNGAINDYVIFNPVLLTNTPLVILSALKCFYGPNLNVSYDITNPKWIPAPSASKFIINYPINLYGGIYFSIRPSISSSIAGILDATKSTEINLAQNSNIDTLGYPIFIERKLEFADYLEVESSFLDNAIEWPSRDLTNSYISWSYTPTSVPVSINAVDLSGNYIQNIPPNSAVIFDYTTWTTSFSGHGPYTIIVSLSSQKYNEVAYLTSNSALFDYFIEENILVGAPYDFNNLNYTRSVYLTALIPYKGRQYYIPNDIDCYWVWELDDNTDYEILPISATYYPISGYSGSSIITTTSSYNYASIFGATTLSGVSFNINLPYSTTVPKTHNFIATFYLKTATTHGTIAGSYSFQPDDFPDPSIFNTDFSVNYSSFPSSKNVIANTRNKQYVITRPNNGTNNFSLSANVDVLPKLKVGNLVWDAFDGTTDTTLGKNLTSINYNISNTSTVNLTLSALSAFAPGWTSAHNIKTTLTFYIMDPVEFAKPLQFNTYPEYFWNSKSLTFSTTANYTLAIAPTAYGNKISNSQTFWLSANKSYLNNFNYFVGSVANNTYQFLINSNSYNQLVDIPYLADFFSASGLPISLTAYNDTSFPSYNGIYYKMPSGGTLNTYIFNLTSKSIPFNTPTNNNFLMSPKIVPYEQVNFSFTSPVSVNLDSSRFVTITQNISSLYNVPDQILGGTVIYSLSTVYWQVTASVPAQNGKYNVFQLIEGDPILPLNVSYLRDNTLVLTATAYTSVGITSDTFNNYSYVVNKNLWNPVTEVVTTSSFKFNALSNNTNPRVFLSTVYTITGSPIFIQYDSPTVYINKSIIGYITDFGEYKTPQISNFDSASFYSYSTNGTFYIKFSALYSDGSVGSYINPYPVYVSNYWETYNPDNVRFINESHLSLPYTLEQVEIQPNEWGDADIFNTSILRLQENLDYLIHNVQTINTNSPSVYFGWLGCNQAAVSEGIRWYSRDYDNFYNKHPEYAISYGKSCFKNIIDAVETSDHILVMDGTTFRAFSANNHAKEVPVIGSDLSYILFQPVSMDVEETGTMVYIADSIGNKVHRCEIVLDDYQPYINISLNVGGLGNRYDNNKLNTPSELVCANNSVYVLDYKNLCIKQFNEDLNWIHTYYDNVFDNDQPINIAIHPIYGLIYTLTSSYKIHIFENLGNNVFSSFNINEANDGTEIIKFIFDELGNFIYIVTTSNVYKYTSDGHYITVFNMPVPSYPLTVTYKGAKKAPNESLLLLTNNAIIKVQDILSIHRIGEGMPWQYWTPDQLAVNRSEFASDLNYNRSLIRIAQNIKTFRDTLNAKLVLATEQTKTAVVTYYATVPILASSRPVFSPEVENENIGVAVNELHVPQVINKYIDMLYQSLLDLQTFLGVSNYNVTGSENSQVCTSPFCWSWGGMSCFNLTLPAIKVCNINPITYSELTNGFVQDFGGQNQWGTATSNCCDTFYPPATA